MNLFAVRLYLSSRLNNVSRSIKIKMLREMKFSCRLLHWWVTWRHHFLKRVWFSHTLWGLTFCDYESIRWTSGLISSPTLTVCWLLLHYSSWDITDLNQTFHSLFFRSFPCVNLKKLLAMHRTINFYFLNYFLKSLLHNFRGSACWNSQCKPVCAQQHGQCLFIHLYFIDFFVIPLGTIHTPTSLSASFAIYLSRLR